MEKSSSAGALVAPALVVQAGCAPMHMPRLPWDRPLAKPLARSWC
jgi:hypothetical protein